MPALRKTLIQLLTELEFSGDARNKEEAAQLLGHLIRTAQGLVTPYVGPVLKVRVALSRCYLALLTGCPRCSLCLGPGIAAQAAGWLQCCSIVSVGDAG